jgi:hypothetical protein
LPAAITKGGKERTALLLELEHMGLPGNSKIHAHGVARTIIDIRVRVRLARYDRMLHMGLPNEYDTRT